MTLEVLKADTLRGVTHGFFTRKGGASSGIFEGLNCGAGSSDQAECVRLNRARAAEVVGLEAGALVSLNQVHSADVVEVEEPFANRPTGDAMITTQPNIALGILTADCAPVLFAADGVVGAAHAGWKGALNGVLEATVAAMRARGAAAIKAAVGPTIAQKSYEVGLDFVDRVVSENADYARFFAQGRDADHAQFDLPGFVLSKLRRLDVEAEWIGHDTYADPARFFSYRRATHRGEADYGRLISIIRL